MAFYTDSKPEQSGYMEDVVDSWSKNVHPMEERRIASFQVTAGRRDQNFAYFWPKKGRFGAFPTDLEKVNGRGPNQHFIAFKSPYQLLHHHLPHPTHQAPTPPAPVKASRGFVEYSKSFSLLDPVTPRLDNVCQKDREHLAPNSLFVPSPLSFRSFFRSNTFFLKIVRLFYQPYAPTPPGINVGPPASPVPFQH